MQQPHNASIFKEISAAQKRLAMTVSKLCQRSVSDRVQVKKLWLVSNNSVQQGN